MNIVKRKNIAVIGCGHWGKNLVRNFSNLGVLRAVCDSNAELAQSTSQTYSVKALNIEEIINDAEIEAVVIASPASQHSLLVEKFVLADKHVFVEKPLALDISEAKKISQLAQVSNKILMVGHLLQYHPAYVKLKEMVLNGVIGNIQYIYSNRLSLGKIRTEENVFWSFAPHDISMILGLTNDLPHDVMAFGYTGVTKGICDISTAHLNFKNGIKAHIFTSWLHPYKEQKLVVVGDNGMIVFDDSKKLEEKLQLYPHKINFIDGVPHPEKAEPVKIGIDSMEPLNQECLHFLNCISNSEKPITDGDEGVNVLRVLDAVQRSLDSGNIVHLEDSNRDYFLHQTAFVDEKCNVGSGSKIWHFSHILNGTDIGKQCVIGQNVMIGPDVRVGDNCKIQNNVSLYKGVIIEDGVFCGPSCVFTNVHNPRSEIERKDEFKITHVEKGVTIGANATIVCGNRLGAYSFIGAGSVVTKDVLPHALVVGNPAKQIGWMSHAGEKLGDDLVCPREGRKYKLLESGLIEEIS